MTDIRSDKFKKDDEIYFPEGLGNFALVDDTKVRLLQKKPQHTTVELTFSQSSKPIKRSSTEKVSDIFLAEDKLYKDKSINIPKDHRGTITKIDGSELLAGIVDTPVVYTIILEPIHYIGDVYIIFPNGINIRSEGPDHNLPFKKLSFMKKHKGKIPLVGAAALIGSGLYAADQYGMLGGRKTKRKRKTKRRRKTKRKRKSKRRRNK